MIRSKNIYLILFIAFLTTFLACKKSQVDVIDTPSSTVQLPKTMYVREGASAVMNVNAFVNTTTQISIAKNAINGVVNLDKGNFLYYAPKSTISSGIDSFSIKINDKVNSIKVVVLSKVTSTIPCELGAMLDKTISDKNKPVSIDVLANDMFCVGADLTTFKIVAQPTNGKLTVSGTTLTFTPNTNFVGIDKAIYMISGLNGTQINTSAEVYFIITDPTLCQISIKPVYLKWSPSATATSLTIDVISKNELCNLPKNSLLISSPPQNGTAKIVNSRIVYTPNSTTPTTQTEVISFAFRDSLGGTYNSFVQIDPDICVPKLLSDYAEWTVSATTPSYTFDVLANDTLCTASKFSISQQPYSGTATIDKTSSKFKIIYTPNAGFKGLDAFIYSATDDMGMIFSGNVKVKVN
jgi:Bacterial Ig domain